MKRSIRSSSVLVLLAIAYLLLATAQNLLDQDPAHATMMAIAIGVLAIVTRMDET